MLRESVEESDPIIDHPMVAQPRTATASAVAQAVVAAGDQSLEDQSTSSLSPSSPGHKQSRTVIARNGAALQRSARLPGKGSSDSLKDPEATDLQRTFARAATLIREAMHVEGVLFYDTAISTFGGLVDTVETMSNTEFSSEQVGLDEEETCISVLTDSAGQRG